MPKKKLSPITLNVLLATGTTAFSLLVAELLVWSINPQITYRHLLGRVPSYFAHSPFGKVTLRPNFRGFAYSQTTSGKKEPISINSLGLRGPEVSLLKEPGRKRILAIGDSYTFGLFVGDGDTYPAQLEKALHEQHPRLEVLNGGYAAGFESDEHYAWLSRRGLEFNPDVVVHGFFPGNDLVVSPEEWAETDELGLPIKFTPRLAIDDNGRIHSGKKTSYTSGSEWIYSVPGLRQSHFFTLLGTEAEKLYFQWQSARTAGGTSPQKDEAPSAYSALWYPHIFGESLAPLTQNMDSMLRISRKRNEVFKKLVLGMKQKSESAGARYLLVMIPFNFQYDEAFLPKVFGLEKERMLINQGKLKPNPRIFEDLKPWLRKHKIPYVDLLEEMKRQKGEYYPAVGEVHFSPEGNRFAAALIAKKLKELGWLN